MDANKIDQHLNAVLRAAGSALRHYSMPKSLEDMRAAMKAAIDDATSELQARVAELEAEWADLAAQKPVAQVDDDECFQGPCRHATAFIPMYRGTLLYAEPPVTAPARLTAEQAEKADANRLDFLERHQLETDSAGSWVEEPTFGVTRVSGGRNDRKWTCIGRGETLREAIDAAIQSMKGES